MITCFFAWCRAGFGLRPAARRMVLALAWAGVICLGTAGASGPHWVAGVTYFDPAAKGKPVVWANGTLTYYIDQGSLSSSMSQSQTVAMLNQAAAVWTAVPTAAVKIVQGGTLSEDVSGTNVTANVPAGTGATLPADVQSTATTKPVGIIMDEDGSVINAIFGPDASDPSECTQNSVFTQIDNMTTAGNLAHGVMILNGLCATTSAQKTLLLYEMVRAFGRLLGLGWSQVNDAMFTSEAITTNGLAGWPIMHSQERLCAGENYSCIPNPTTLRLDDIAGLNRLYPVTSANIGSFSNKKITAQNTLSVQGTISFSTGQGMQGVNVVLTPLSNGAPLVQYAVSAVSGASYHSNIGNLITGATDAQGNSLNRYGTDAMVMEGFFDLSGVPLPTGTTVSDYQLSFEAVNPSYIDASINGLGNDELGVGPYSINQVSPSGTLPTITLTQLSANSVVANQSVTIANSASGTADDDGTQAAPAMPQANGEWLSRLGEDEAGPAGSGHTGWFLFTARANRTFTVEALALDQTGVGTTQKSGVLIGLWNGSDPMAATPALTTTLPFNGNEVGLTTLSAQTSTADQIRVAFGDMRGVGRPDFLYRGRVLYADTVFPARLTPAGGPIVIMGSGFRANAQVTVNGVNATVTSVTPNEITAVAPASSGTTGVVAVTVEDPQTLGTTSILDGLSYDAYGSDQISLISGPTGSLSQGVPVPFGVRVLAADNVTPAANVAVSYATVEGGAALGCGASSCSVTTNGAGYATLMVSPTSAQTTRVTATLTSGASVTAEFNGSAAPQIAAMTPTLYVAIGSQVSWQPSVIVLNGGTAVSGSNVVWSAGSPGITVQGTAASTNSAGLASTTVMAGPLSAGATAVVNACEALSPLVCAPSTVVAEDASLATLLEVSGAGQNLPAAATPAQVILEVTDAAGRPLAGATVNLYETLSAWQPACPSTGRCPATETLATQSVTAVSNANGLVTLTPLTGAGQPTTLIVDATTGSQASMVFSIVQHP